MASLIEGYQYDIFISYRQKDNKGEKWVSEFVEALKTELESTFKEDISVYFDTNPHDGLLETHEVNESLKDKLKCLVFIPIISRTYCDPKAFAWGHELKSFIERASNDQIGLKVKLPGGNVASRVLPVRIHDLDNDDLKLCESVLGGVLRGVEFIYKSTGVNRPLTPSDNPDKNLNKTFYRDQINKVALAIRDIIQSIKQSYIADEAIDNETNADIKERLGSDKTPEVKKHNLPISTTSFVGRKQEMKELKDLFHKSRLVTITGAGGCGKTRLAREIALTLVEEYKDGVWFVDLSPLSDPILVAKEIACVLNIKEEPGIEIVDTMIENINDKSFLLLLDNCEHLLEACAKVTDKLLKSVNGIRILATSREALNIPGEVVWRIPSLSFPQSDSKKDIDEIQHFEAIRLFTDRAALKNPGFTLNSQNIEPVAGICRCVAGIPLAIELSATRIRHMGPDTILERLENQFEVLSSSIRTAPERQQTLKATIDWSYNLLSEQEQLLFNRLSVFEGDFNLEAAEEVCSDEKIEKENILTLQSQLVDKSLIIAENQEDGSVRYKLLVPLRKYSLQKLTEIEEDKIFRNQHLSYYLKIAENAYEEQYELQLKWFNILSVESDNLMAALSWSLNNSADDFIRLAGSLSWFWIIKSQHYVCKDLLEKAISKDTGNSEARARVLFGLGYTLLFLKNYEDAKNLIEQSLDVWRSVNNSQEQANVLGMLGYLYLVKFKDIETGLKFSDQALEFAKSTGKPGLLNRCLAEFCHSLVHSKQFERAIPYVEELLISSEKLNQPFELMNARHYHSDCALGIKDFEEAEKRYCLGIKTGLEYGNGFVAFADMQGVAFALSGQSRWAKAIRLNAASCEKARSMGVSVYGMVEFWDEWIDTYIEGAKKEIGEELTCKYEEEGINMGFEAAVNYALDFDKD